MNNINYDYIKGQTKNLPSFIFERYITSYGREEIGVECPICGHKNFHGNINLNIARTCFQCGRNYYLTPAPDREV